MRPSSILRVVQFVRNKEMYMMGTPAYKQHWLAAIRSLCGAIFVLVMVEEFGFFTPDLRYDIRMKLSPQFRDRIRRDFEFDLAPDMGVKISAFQESLKYSAADRELANTRIFSQD
uniref:Uncharacterized protein n=1 Tax=Plectus sambesii TaxID=2011161 RepID=A0A914VUK2_9BILA